MLGWGLLRDEGMVRGERMHRTMAGIAGMLGMLSVMAAGLAGMPSSAAAAPPIKIGSFLSLTGPAAYLGDPEDKTIRLYVDEINAAGGVLGRTLELIVYDDEGEANQARTFGRRLIEEHKVDVLIGGTTTAATMAVVPLAEEAHVPFLSLAEGVHIVDPVKRWVFKTPHTDLMACEKIFRDLARRGMTNIGLISGTDAFGRSMRDQCVKLAPNYDIQISVDETYGPGDTDLTRQFAKIRAVQGIQALVNPGVGQGPALVVRTYQQFGMKLPLYESHGVASARFIELAGNAAEGVRMPAAALLIADLLPDSDPQKSVEVDYKRQYEKRWNSPASPFGGHAYDALFITVAAMKRAGTVDKEAVRDEIEKTRGFVGTAGTVNMSPTDHLGITMSAFPLLEIRNGNWTLPNEPMRVSADLRN